jgi:hypothetical protein
MPERATSKSAVSRRFVALTTAQLTTWLATPLDGLDIQILTDRRPPRGLDYSDDEQ